jgi:carbamoyl-phosphate synthase large subunit
MIGANREAIKVAENRLLFKQAMDEAGLEMPRGGFAKSWDEAKELVAQTGYPAIIRPSFTLGGTGGGTAYNPEEFEEIVRGGLAASPIPRGAHRGVNPWLERIRARSDARPRR